MNDLNMRKRPPLRPGRRPTLGPALPEIRMSHGEARQNRNVLEIGSPPHTMNENRVGRFRFYAR